VHSEDPAASTAAIGRLRTLLATIGVTPTALPAGSGAEAGFEVAVPGHAGLSVSVAVKGDRFVIAYGADALAAALAPGARLGDTGAFADAKSTLDGAEPTFFLDVPAVVGLLEGPAGNDPRFAKLKPTLDALGPMAAGTSRDGGTPRLQVGVKVK
jgi:hypothetical protein